MKKFSLLLVALLVTTSVSLAARNWKEAKIETTSETDVSWKVWGQKNTLHYTIETEDMVYFAEFTYKPGTHGDNHAPNIAANALTKIAIEGRHAYILDVAGKEVKLHITKKMKIQK
jgi:hypothetical protein